MPYYDYEYPEGSQSSRPKSNSKYTAGKIEADLRKTLSFLSKVIQSEFIHPERSGRSERPERPEREQLYRSQSYHGESSSRVAATGQKAKWDELSFDEILVKGRKKLEKLVRKYKELNPNASGRREAYEPEGYGAYENASGRRWQEADEIEEVESVRSSRNRGTSGQTPRGQSPPPSYYHGQSRHGYAARDARDWAGVNPEYHVDPNNFQPHSPSNAKPPKRASTGLSLDKISKINLPALITYAGVILGIIEKILEMNVSRKNGSTRGVSNSNSGIHTALKVVKMVVALTEGVKDARPGDFRRQTYNQGSP